MTDSQSRGADGADQAKSGRKPKSPHKYSLAPLTFDEAVDRLLQAKPEKKGRDGGKKGTDQPKGGK